MKNKLYEVKEYRGKGYKTLIGYEQWRVAILNYIDELQAEAITTMQKHNETDEVFVLLKGSCILFFGECENMGKESIQNITCVKLEPNKLYNVKKGVYHTHTLSKDASVLIIENDDTSDENSPTINLCSLIKNKLVRLSNNLLGGSNNE